MIRIQTVPTLQLIHQALRSGDPRQLAAAESVLSALIVVVRREEADIPNAVGPYLETLKRR